MIKTTTQNNDNDFVFSGSLVDGPSIDLIELSGLELTDDEQDRVWENTSPRDLLDEAGCEEIELEEFEGGPGMSDTFYEYRCGPKETFVSELRAVLLRYLGREK